MRLDSGVALAPPQPAFHFQVWDRDLGKDDLLGLGELTEVQVRSYFEDGSPSQNSPGQDLGQDEEATGPAHADANRVTPLQGHGDRHDGRPRHVHCRNADAGVNPDNPSGAETSEPLKAAAKTWLPHKCITVPLTDAYGDDDRGELSIG
jgi:hypothetical protein